MAEKRDRYEMSGVPPEANERLAAMGLPPWEESCERWLAEIRSGEWPLSKMIKPGDKARGKRRRSGWDQFPGVRRIPIVLPLALVLPDEALGLAEERDDQDGEKDESENVDR